MNEYVDIGSIAKIPIAEFELIRIHYPGLKQDEIVNELTLNITERKHQNGADCIPMRGLWACFYDSDLGGQNRHVVVLKDYTDFVNTSKTLT